MSARPIRRMPARASSSPAEKSALVVHVVELVTLDTRPTSQVVTREVPPAVPRRVAVGLVRPVLNSKVPLLRPPVPILMVLAFRTLV